MKADAATLFPPEYSLYAMLMKMSPIINDA